MAHYSALFTLGLLSERGSPPSSPTHFSQFRKSSLPTRTFSRTSETVSVAIDMAENAMSPVEFTNPFGAPSPRQQSPGALRSFLSLDLAENPSQRAAKYESQALSPLDISSVPLVNSLSARSDSPRSRGTPSPRHPSPLPSPIVSSSRRPSRDSTRHIPSPKPAPSFTTLPEVPKALRSAPAPISIGSPVSPRSTFSSSHRPTHSAPAVVSPTSPAGQSSVGPTSPTSSRRVSYLSFSSTNTSIRTSRKRSAHRDDALACLEGRSPAPYRIPRTRHRNFMSMTDDEDDGDDEGDGTEFEVPHSRFTISQSVIHAAPPPTPHMPYLQRFDEEEEDRVLPSTTLNVPYVPLSKSQPQSKRSSAASMAPSLPKGRRRRSTMESWFPLANFIDFKDDDAGWRGFVEFASAV